MSELAKIYEKAFAALNSGRLAEAETLFRKFLKAQPKHLGALNLLTVVLMSLGRYSDAEPFIRTAVSIDQSSAKSYNNYALILKNMNRPEEALEKLTASFRLNPRDADTLTTRGVVLAQLGKLGEALQDFDAAIALRPAAAAAYYGKGNALSDAGRFDDALAAYDRALALDKMLAEAWVGRGNALGALKRPEDALAAYDRALALKRNLVAALTGRAKALAELRRMDEAIEYYEKAIKQDPTSVAAWFGLGNLHDERGFSAEAVDCYDKLLALDPQNIVGWMARGAALTWLKRLDEAAESLQRAYALNPEFEPLLGPLYSVRTQMCDWTDFEQNRNLLVKRAAESAGVCSPFLLFGAIDSPCIQLRVTKLYTDMIGKDLGFPDSFSSHPRRDRIRIAYISADFYNHATMYLMAQLFNEHDRRKFEVFAFAIVRGPDDENKSRARTAFDHYIDVYGKSDHEIAQIARDLEIDIAVDLKGYTQFARPSVFAFGLAPIQVNYLGYPGTVASPHIQYIVADPVVIPQALQQYYSEKIVRLPDTYLATDNTRPISARQFTRAELGLPATGFIFCCFNNNWKILPDVFDGWMRILGQVEGSVLWIFKDNEVAAGNLRKEAAQRGIDPDRLVFAGFAPNSEHLARLRIADLFLDTRPCNAHTTTVDALWAGLPVLTRIGEAFASRVAASLLTAVGLPELITTSDDDYEALAVALAREPARLGELRQRLAVNVATQPLFDTVRYTRHLEDAFVAMYERHHAGLPPDHISIMRRPQ